MALNVSALFMERLLWSCPYKQDPAGGKAGAAAQPATPGVTTEAEPLAHRRRLLGSSRSRKGKSDTRLDFLKMKWELETSKTGILVLKFNVSETHGSHMQLQKHLASYFWDQRS